MSPAVIPLSPAAARARLRDGPPLLVIDVRPPQERALASIVEPVRTLDADGLDESLALPRQTPIAFLCHHGVRSAAAAAYFTAQGFIAVYNVEGGIEAWALQADATVPRY